MKTVIVQINQSIWDIAIQEYGSPDGVIQLMIDNPTICNFHESLSPGTRLILNGEILNKTVYEYLAQRGIKPSTGMEVPDDGNWILITGNWDDEGVWDDLAVWNDGFAPPIYNSGLANTN